MIARLLGLFIGSYGTYLCSEADEKAAVFGFMMGMVFLLCLDVYRIRETLIKISGEE